MEKINHQILQLWEESSAELVFGRMPGFISDLKLNSMLFIGINPSFSERGFDRVLKEPSYSELDIHDFYKYPKSDSFDIGKAIEIENLSVKRHPYFRRFEIVSNAVGIEWEHIDLFFVRETKQRNLSKVIFEKGENLNSFGEKQVCLSKKIIEKIRPRVIVVANALASRIFQKAFDAKFDTAHGCHFVLINGKLTPVFLTGMLTGQRALDNFTFKRLCWHIKEVTSKATYS